MIIELNSVKEGNMIELQEHPEIKSNPQKFSQAQAKVQAFIDDLVLAGLETGLQVAAYLNGNLAIDAWSGIANPETGRPVDHDTLFMTFSCSKGVTATVI